MRIINIPNFSIKKYHTNISFFNKTCPKGTSDKKFEKWGKG